MIVLKKSFEKVGIGKIRIALLNNELMFNLYDACFGLGYTSESKDKTYLYKTRIENVCKNLDIKGFDGVSNNEVEITKYVDFERAWINEQNFYDLCLESHAKNARAFRRWVTGEVLPSINRTGEYKLNKELMFESKLENLKLEQQGLKFTIEMLNTTEASTVKMLKDFNTSMGLSTAYLPDYVDEEAGKSATELLKQFNVPMNVRQFNKLMLENGLIEEKTRRSTNKAGFKKYKKLTDKALKYGKNKMSTAGTEKETQPLYYEDTFMELINFLNSLKGVM